MSTGSSSATVPMESSESLSMVNDTSCARLGVLGNPDLLELIFEHFGGEEGILSPYYQGPVRQVTKRNLLWACLTARSFATPALTILWRHMESIWPLVLVLPNLRLENGSYRLIGPIDGPDLQRLLFYSRRIRVLHIDGETTYTKVATSLLQEICYKIQDLEPLSSLQQLFIWFDRLDSKQLILFSLISLSNVNTLHLKTFLSITAPTTSSFLQSARFKSQLKNIRQLRITGNFSAIDPRLPDFTNLQHLHLSDVSSSMPACFLSGCASSMPFLQSLRLYLFSEVEDHHASGAVHHDPVRFEMLSRLDLGSFPKAVGFVMDIIRVPMVDSLTICMLQGGHIDVSTVISTFIRHNRQTAKQTIREITIAFESHEPQDFDLSSEDFNAFERLEVLFFHASLLQITGPQLSKFLGRGEDWLNIRELALLYDFSDNPEQTLAIAALATIADRCPNLHRLEISIYNPDQSEMRDGVKPRTLHNLRELELRGLPRAWDYSESFAITLASFLHYIFPRLYKAECFHSFSPGELDNWWEMVRKNLTVRQRSSEPRSRRVSTLSR